MKYENPKHNRPVNLFKRLTVAQKKGNKAQVKAYKMNPCDLSKFRKILTPKNRKQFDKLPKSERYALANKIITKHTKKFPIKITNPSPDALKQGVRVFNEWHNHPKIKASHADFKDIELPGKMIKGKNRVVLAKIGKAVDMSYESNKFNKKKETYIYEFKQKPLIYSNTKGTALIIAPIKLNKRGITS